MTPDEPGRAGRFWLWLQSRWGARRYRRMIGADLPIRERRRRALRGWDGVSDFYEEDEPAEDIKAAWEQGEHVVTAAPPSPSVPVESREQPRSVVAHVRSAEFSVLEKRPVTGHRLVSADLLTVALAQRDRARDLAAHLEDALTRSEKQRWGEALNTDMATADAYMAERRLALVAALHVKFDGGGDRSNRCAHDGFKWPCVTARALAAHLEAEQAEED